jgi:hypothetical protein
MRGEAKYCCSTAPPCQRLTRSTVTKLLRVTAASLSPAVHARLTERDGICLRAAFEGNTSKRMHFGTVLGICVSREQVNRFPDCGFRKSIPET